MTSEQHPPAAILLMGQALGSSAFCKQRTNEVFSECLPSTQHGFVQLLGADLQRLDTNSGMPFPSLDRMEELDASLTSRSALRPMLYTLCAPSRRRRASAVSRR
jgi:hypothetical protein